MQPPKHRPEGRWRDLAERLAGNPRARRVLIDPALEASNDRELANFREMLHGDGVEPDVSIPCIDCRHGLWALGIRLVPEPDDRELYRRVMVPFIRRVVEDGIKRLDEPGET